MIEFLITFQNHLCWQPLVFANQNSSKSSLWYVTTMVKVLLLSGTKLPLFTAGLGRHNVSLCTMSTLTGSPYGKGGTLVSSHSLPGNSSNCCLSNFISSSFSRFSWSCNYSSRSTPWGECTVLSFLIELMQCLNIFTVYLCYFIQGSEPRTISTKKQDSYPWDEVVYSCMMWTWFMLLFQINTEYAPPQICYNI